ncbi:MAG TPA: VWA domain-containing protein [Actinomycetota bacterium]|nr:VWA domain-containing protein [Actinomycetota bacterium]
MSLLDRLQSFSAALRDAGVPVSNHEMLVATQALSHLDLADRNVFRAGLAASMCRAPGHLETFARLFDLFFAPHVTERREVPEALEELSEDQLLEALDQAVAGGPDGDIRRISQAILDRLSADASGGFLLYRALRFADPDRMLRRLAGDEGDDLDSALERMRVSARLQRLRRILEQEVRRRMVADSGPEDVAQRILRAPLEERDFTTITSDEVADARRAVIALARRLSTRLAKLRKQGARGRLDMRRTLRASLSSGGTLADPKFKVRSPSRPDLVLLCDVSGSVAAFTRFTLLLVAALQVQFPRIRSFLFVDTVDEVTDVLKAQDPSEAIPRALQIADVVWLDGHSDYGHSLKVFHDRYLDAVGERTHVVILGDARSNYRKPEEWVVKELRRRAKRVWWLNPEAQRHWDTGDSVVSAYAPHCEAVHECRNLRQLGRFVEKLA